MKPVTIAMWSGPRNISTAMMRSFENRDDAFVSDEPFYAHYLNQTGVDHPMREEILNEGEINWNQISNYITGDIPHNKSIWYQKHMAQHNLPEVNLEWTKKVNNCFLIRDPAEVIISYSKKFEITSINQLGFPQQIVLYNYIAKQMESLPIVLDSKDLLKNPKNILEKLCEKLNIPFMESMLSWPTGKRDSDGIWGQHWYGNVEQSTGFQKYKKENEKIPPKYFSIYEKCINYYQKLYERRLN